MGDLRLRRIGLTGWRRFCQTRRRQVDLESGGRTFPATFFASFGNPAIQNQRSGDKKGRNHESTDSAHNNSTTSYHSHIPLLRAFAKSAGGCPAARRRLSGGQHGRGSGGPV